MQAPRFARLNCGFEQDEHWEIRCTGLAVILSSSHSSCFPEPLCPDTFETGLRAVISGVPLLQRDSTTIAGFLLPIARCTLLIKFAHYIIGSAESCVISDVR